MGTNTSSPRTSQRLSLLAAALLMAGTAMAQQTTYPLDIAPQALDQALNALAGQTGSRILFATDVAEGRQVPGLRGSLTVEQALERLVGGTGLRVEKTADGSFLVSRPQSGEALELSSVTISGKAPGSITEGTGQYTTRSTSSSTRLNLSPQETPQSITVMTRQRMEDQKLDTVAAVLAATPGIVVQTVQVGEDSPNIYARGSIINNFQIDGVPTSSSMSSDLQDTAIYDRVEVVRGATGLMSGLGLPSATVNLIRKRPTFEPQARISMEAGSWDRYGTGVDVSGPLNEEATVRGRLVADYKSDKAWVDRFDQEQYVVYGIGEVDLSESTLLTAGFSHVTKKANSPIRPFMLRYSNGQRIDFDASDNKSPSWSYYDHDQDNVFVSLEHQFDSGWSTKLEYNHTLYRYDSVVTSVLGTVDQATGAGTELYPSHWRSKLNQNTIDGYLTGPFSLLGRQHELIAGVTLSQLHGESPDFWETENYVIPDFLQWADTTPKPGFTKEGESESDEYQYSAYLSTRLHVTDSLSVLLGSRVLDWKYERDYEATGGARSQSERKENGVFIPYAGVVYALDDTWSLYASYTKIFQPQTSRVLQYSKSPIEPEEGTSYETGIKASFQDGRLSSSLALFKTEQDNLAVWNGNLYTYDVVSGVDTQGVELEFNGELAEGWRFGSGYAYSVTTNGNDDRILTQLPRHNVKLFTTYRLPGDLNHITVGGGVNWQSKIGEDLSVYTQESYALVNLMARYDINKNLSAALHLNNVFDKEYFMGVNSSYGTYGPPRNVMTSLNYNF